MKRGNPDHPCQCEACQQSEGETLRRHRLLMVGARALHVYRAGPMCTLQGDGLIVLYGEAKREQVQ